MPAIADGHRLNYHNRHYHNRCQFITPRTLFSKINLKITSDDRTVIFLILHILSEQWEN